MRFEFYHSGLENTPKLSVDGTVDEKSFHLSHWEGNHTPPELRADTSTEIALNLVAAPNMNELTGGIDLVTNNHFDTDGVLSVWTVLTGEKALALRESLIAAAEAGDFSEFSNENAVRASIVIQGADQAGSNSDTVSPLARMLSREDTLDDARCYELVLPEVEAVLTQPEKFESLWRPGWDEVEKSLESFARGSSTVTEFPQAGLSLITLAPEIFSSSGFDPTRHVAPFTAISHNARGRLFVIAVPTSSGWIYRIDYPYYSWAETAVRPRIRRHDLTSLLDQLNQLEQIPEGKWQTDRSEMTSAAKFLGADGLAAASRLTPDIVASLACAQLAGDKLSISAN
jgi:hypothetical protein